VSFKLEPGEAVGVVGESGSGKSLSMLSLLGLLPDGAHARAAHARFDGRDLLSLTTAQLNAIRGREIAIVFQDPLTALNPVLTIGRQITEVIRRHFPVSKAEANQRAEQLLARVGIPDPPLRLRQYPHQFSGGMRQRVTIAMALAGEPRILIADEPTTALDVTIQSQILAEVQALCAESGTALIWITHDLAVVAGLADRVAVMYAGRIIEEGPVDAVLAQPLHPYTRGLIGSVPSRNRRGAPLAQIPGMAPSPAALPPGCAFSPRCPRADAACAAAPAMTAHAGGRAARCWHPYLLESAA